METTANGTAAVRSWAIMVEGPTGRWIGETVSRLSGHVIGTRSQVDAFVAEENAHKAAERGRFTCGSVTFRVQGWTSEGPCLADFTRCACGGTAYRCATCGGWSAAG